jgi:hypothetical protein
MLSKDLTRLALWPVRLLRWKPDEFCAGILERLGSDVCIRWPKADGGPKLTALGLTVTLDNLTDLRPTAVVVGEAPAPDVWPDLDEKEKHAVEAAVREAWEAARLRERAESRGRALARLRDGARAGPVAAQSNGNAAWSEPAPVVCPMPVVPQYDRHGRPVGEPAPRVSSADWHRTP